MPEHATLYCPQAGMPGVAELRELAPDAEVRAMRAGFLAQGGELIVAWPDIRLRVSAWPRASARRIWPASSASCTPTAPARTPAAPRGARRSSASSPSPISTRAAGSW
jgi:hypothetical protein